MADEVEEENCLPHFLSSCLKKSKWKEITFQSQAPEMITVSNHNIITERNNVYVSEREKEGRAKG